MVDASIETDGTEPKSTPALTGAACSDPDAGATSEQVASLGLSRGDTRFALVCGAAILLLLLGHWAQRVIDGRRLVEIDRLPASKYEFRLDINSATWVEWMQLDGVGEVLARRIVADRNEHGPFVGIDDVSRVPGVGPKTLAAIRPQLFCSDCPRADSQP
ncbi:MAG: helix-hairpin-helix domain-containing protein [Planctomycetaceae bacterium]|nr:helix-hairpin-helix domain-containing protein [Planctomycetaceae bacterium]